MKKNWIHTLLGLFLVGLISIQNAQAQTPAGPPAAKVDLATGIIKGRVVDAETKVPLAGVTITIAATNHKAETDAAGGYALLDVGLGYYTLSFELKGYYVDTRTDIIVRSGRTTFLNVELLPVRALNEEVRVVAAYFPPAPTASGTSALSSLRAGPTRGAWSSRFRRKSQINSMGS
jgi:hypothetical protein